MEGTVSANSLNRRGNHNDDNYDINDDHDNDADEAYFIITL